MNRLLSKSAKLHDTKLSLTSFPFDLNVFKETKTECNRRYKTVTDNCSTLKRLCAATYYHETIKASSTLNDDEKKSLLIEFHEEVYESVLDDVAHFVKEHDGDILRVHNEWMVLYGFAKCSVSECGQTERHYGGGRRDRKRERESEEEDALYAFYESLYDRMHHYIFHLYEVGLRVDAESLKLKEDGGEENGMENEGVSVDEVFAAERDQIKTRRKQCNIDFDRFEGDSNKFTIQTANEQQGVTLRDALFEELSRIEKISSPNVQRYRQFIEQNAFDSDAVEMDLEREEDSNLYNLIENESVVESLKTFIRSINLRRAAFSTGFEFKYKEKVYSESTWSRKEIKKEVPFVKPKYNNLKEEILASCHLKLSEWMEHVYLKGMKYLKSETVKKMKQRREYMEKRHRYDHLELSLEHLIAIILYCDFSALCTAFSATFRRKNVFETLESVVTRHSEFAHFGGLLVEMVNRFGINRYRGNGAQQCESGPFYCGINCVLNIGSFAINLKGPCSTSIVAAVAMNFAKSDGVILKLDNDTQWAKYENFFDCSWISNYFEENERLWIAGYNPLRIESIVLMRTAKNYWKAMKALYLFDAMISGVDQDNYDRDCGESEYGLISKLINWTLHGGDAGDAKIDWFIKNEWRLFLQKKKKILLDLFQMRKHYLILSDLVMYKVVKDEQDVSTQKNEKDNILRPEWISMFSSLETVTIRTNGTDYKFSLEALLDSIKSLSPTVTVIVSRCSQWIDNELTEDIYSLFDAAGWRLDYQKRGDLSRGYNVVIKSKKH